MLKGTFKNRSNPGRRLMGLLLLAAVAVCGGLLAYWARRSHCVMEVMGTISRREYFGRMAFSSDGKFLVLPEIGYGHVELWNLEQKECRTLGRIFKDGPVSAFKAVFSHDSQLLAVYYEPRNPKHCIVVWCPSSGTEITTIELTEHTYLSKLSFLDDRDVLVGHVRGLSDDLRDKDMYRNTDLVYWDAVSGRRLKSVPLPFDLAFDAISPNGRFGVYRSTSMGTVVDLATGEDVCVVPASHGFVFSDDGSMLVSYEGPRLSAWKIPSGENIAVFTLASGTAGGYRSDDCLALSRDQKLLAVGRYGGSNHTSALICLRTGKVLETFESSPKNMICHALALSPDGRLLVTNTEPNTTEDRWTKPLLRFWRITVKDCGKTRGFGRSDTM